MVLGYRWQGKDEVDEADGYSERCFARQSYAYRTEKTYLHWIRQYVFPATVFSTIQGAGGYAGITFVANLAAVQSPLDRIRFSN